MGVLFLGPCPVGLQLLPGAPPHPVCSIQILETVSSPLLFRLGVVMEPRYY